MTENQFSFKVTEAQRLDKYLVTCFPEHSRSRLQSLIKQNCVIVNGKPSEKAGQALEVGDQVEITIPPVEPSNLVAEDIALDVIFENKDLVIFNKPAGMVVHPAAGHSSGTLVNAALGYVTDLEGIGGEQRPGVVHRLDKDTSGLIVMAKNDRALRWLQDQFRLRKVQKIYLALVDGAPPTPKGRIEAPIGRDLVRRQRMSIVPIEKGRNAESEYAVVERFLKHTLVEVHPFTGRTHQIRLHMALLECPIVGDETYGRHRSSLPLGRHFLHAWRLTIQLPGENEARTFEAPLPEDLVKVLESLRRI